MAQTAEEKLREIAKKMKGELYRGTWFTLECPGSVPLSCLLGRPASRALAKLRKLAKAVREVCDGTQDG